MRDFILFAIMLLLFAGCKQKDEVDNKLDMADRIMEEDTDDATISIGILNSIGKSNVRMTKAQIMRCYLLQAKAKNKAHVQL